MVTLKNLDKRLITINHGGKRYDIKCGDNPSVEVPDEVMKTDFVKHLVDAGKLTVMSGAVVIAQEPPADNEDEHRAELKAMTVAELKEHCKLLDLSGYSKLKEDELIDFIIANS
jgi:hypothetical protein